ncbi:hypothetical protein Lpp225_2179 [Lacticaseibacillus paracasei subsp. paracasei Lpp225]|uniref:Uncharacterized protein n=1 Tax=Lacticaseibacillus paracasei subsp. paracasei Lpp225 TaxID=1256225 RepID=S2NQC5_LACPA|nr:hypothetical protein Lpp225_2179 [Lacticaseibacillus paracasei subsp. paracasei Lpp225]
MVSTKRRKALLLYQMNHAQISVIRANMNFGYIGLHHGLLDSF